MCSGGNILTRQCVPGETYLLGNVFRGKHTYSAMCSGGNIFTRQCVPGETYLLGNVLFPVIPALPPRRFLLELLHAMLSHVHRLWVSNFNIENRNRIKWHFNSTYLCSSGSLLSWIALRKFEKKKKIFPPNKSPRNQEAICGDISIVTFCQWLEFHELFVVSCLGHVIRCTWRMMARVRQCVNPVTTYKKDFLKVRWRYGVFVL